MIDPSEARLFEAMQWQRHIERIHSWVKPSIPTPKDRTDKGYYECIAKVDDLRERVTSWLSWMEQNGKRSVKDATRAKRLREEGNAFFKKKNYHSAIESYTQSARYATPDDHDFSTALGNRSAALFRSCRYKESLSDIELALATGYPENKRWKLHVRATECHLALGQPFLAKKEAEESRVCLEKDAESERSEKDEIVRQIEEEVGKMSINGRDRSKKTKEEAGVNPENMLARNAQFPYASTGIVRKQSPTRGRYVVARRDIKKGEILFAEKPFAWVPVSHGNKASLCAHCCGDMDDSLLPCNGCLDALYCSVRCWRDSRDYHRWECPGYEFSLWQQIGVSHLALKIFLLTTTCTDRVSFNEVHKLVTNVDKTNMHDLSVIGIASLMVTVYMEKYTNFFDLVDLNECLVEKFADPRLSLDVDVSTIEGKRLYVGTMIFRHSLQMLENAYAVTRISEVARDDSGDPLPLFQRHERVATGTYPSASMLNHSCDPTVINSFWKNWLIVKAVKNVAAGQEIFNSYGSYVSCDTLNTCDGATLFNTIYMSVVKQGPYFRRMSKSTRQTHLASQYAFRCNCEICSDPRYDLFVERFNGLKCPKCLGSSNVDRCYDCGVRNELTIDDHLQRAAKLSEQGMNLVDLEKWIAAIPCFEKCLAIQEKYLYRHNEDLAITHDALGQCYAAKGHWLTSLAHLEKSLAAIEERYGSDSIEVANELNTITDICIQYLNRSGSSGTEEYRENFMKARKYVDRALAIIDITSGFWNPAYREVTDKKEQLSKMLDQLRIYGLGS